MYKVWLGLLVLAGLVWFIDVFCKGVFRNVASGIKGIISYMRGE